MFFIASAFAATLPTECPTAIVTGDEVADLRAELVAPVTVSAGQAVAALRVDAGCPSEDGSACTDSNGDAWEGMLVEGRESRGCDGLQGTSVVAAGVSWIPAAGAPSWVSATGSWTSGSEGDTDWCYAEDAWSGALSVQGAWGPLSDASIDADASVREDWGYDPYCNHNTSEFWEGTSGDCGWSASTYQFLCDGTFEAQDGTVTVGESTVRWLTEQETCDGFPDPVWYALLWIDDVPVAPSDPYWDGGRIGETWVDVDLDGYSITTDCDDANPDIHPCGTEVPGNAVDEDCDGAASDVDHDGWSVLYDCDDLDPNVYDGADEVCGDGVDQDCDGVDATDADGDGYCDDADCDDADPTTWDGAPDDADAVDHDCDGDADEDGYLPTARNADCDDGNAAIHPRAEEVPYDGVDNDCSGGDADDLDHDGHAAIAAGGDDCDDTDDAVRPSVPELACDGVDQDCDGADRCDSVAADARRCGCGTSSPYGSILALLIAAVSVRRR